MIDSKRRETAYVITDGDRRCGHTPFRNDVSETDRRIAGKSGKELLSGRTGTVYNADTDEDDGTASGPGRYERGYCQLSASRLSGF